MTYYLKLQLTRLQRWLQNLGINPYFALVLGLIFFVLLSKSLFYKTEYAKWIYLFTAISIIFKCSEQKRNDTLRNIFRTNDYLKLRIAENFIVATPFVLYLIFNKEFSTAFILLPMIPIMAYFRTNNFTNYTIPTPFKKYPFEFIIGFRRTFPLILIAYFLVFKGIQVENYNLGLFGLMLNFIISIFYFQKPEPESFVRIYKYRTNDFLRLKIVNASICISILSFIALTAILIAFSSEWKTTIIAYLGGIIMLGSMVLAKYSAFPSEISIPQAILYGLSLLFPPMLLITIWIFYSQSKKRLEPILR